MGAVMASQEYASTPHRGGKGAGPDDQMESYLDKEITGKMNRRVGIASEQEFEPMHGLG